MAIPDSGPRRAVVALFSTAPSGFQRPWVAPAAHISEHRHSSASAETPTVSPSTCYSFFGVKEKQLKGYRPKDEGHNESVQDGVVFTSQSVSFVTGKICKPC